jgi:periplasmic mercuric ion binding protein
MKRIKTLIAAFTLLLAVNLNASAQDSKTETVKIKTSSVCTMCKATLEKAMAYEKGIKSSNLDVKTQMLTVTYRTDKTNFENILKAVSATGYDADQLPADPRAYDRLNECCKKDKGIH